MERITKAEVGEEHLIKFSEDPLRSSLRKKDQKKGTVKDSCGHNTPLGRWACLTHNVIFGNQMNKDGHIHTGNHRLAWWCPKCVAYETP
jgi:hypothetical protein